MRIIIDTNVLFSALIKDSITRRLILEYDDFFLFPEYVFEELDNHKQEIIRKSGMAEKDFSGLLQLLLQKVMVVPNEVLFPFREEALEIIKEIDRDDAIFIACALTYSQSVLWSDDKALKSQSKVIVLNTSEIMEIL